MRTFVPIADLLDCDATTHGADRGNVQLTVIGYGRDWVFRRRRCRGPKTGRANPDGTHVRALQMGASTQEG